MGESEVPAPRELPFKRSTMYSFPVEVKINSLREFTELEAIKISPEKSWEKSHINIL